MKNAFKIALPTVLAIVLGWIAVEGIKAARDRYNAERQAKKHREAIAAQTQADSQAEEE